MKKIISILTGLVLLLSFAFAAACSKKVDDSDKTLEIYYLKAGYGEEFIKAMEERFEEKYPEYDVVIRGDSKDTHDVQLKAGPKGNSVDLFITGGNYNSYARSGADVLKGYDVVLEPIDDVFNATVDGVKVMDKFISGFSPVEINGHYYSFPWATGFTGLVYNESKFNTHNIEVPLTTNQLLSVCATAKSKSEIPFTFATETNYWEYLRDIWYAQYESIDGVKDFFNGVDYDGGRTREIFYQDGRLESLKVMDSLLNYTKENNHSLVNSMSFTSAQAKYITGEGLMMVNGDWLENEMKSLEGQTDVTYSFKFMKTPVISSIIKNCDSIPDEDTLIKVIKYVDGNLEKTEIATVSDGDIAKIGEARSISHAIGFNHTVGIPSYATAKEAAKKFLTFMASDEAWQIYFDTTKGNQLPFIYNVESDTARYAQMTSFAKSRYELMKTAVYPSRFVDSRLSAAGLSYYSGDRNLTEIYFTSIDARDRREPEAIIKAEYDSWTVEKWASLLKTAGY